MSKTNIILLSVIALILLAGAVATYIIVNPKKVSVPQAARNTTDLASLQQQTLTADKTHEDESGFSFKYPNQFSVKDTTPINDTTYYSKVEIAGVAGKITLSVVDTTYKSLSDWQKTNKEATLVGASTLAGAKANQYERGSQLLTVAIDQGVLYTIENISDNATLDEVHNLIVSTFKFADQPIVTAPATSSSTEVEYEAEEIIE